MKKTYYTVDGTIIGESAAGVRTDYMTDALGSVTGTLNQSGQVLNTYRYKPYGGLLAKTGTSADPSFQWVGSKGYRNTANVHSEIYVRRRHDSTVEGRWTSRDPIYLSNLYRYAASNPATLTDPSGLQARPCPPKNPCSSPPPPPPLHGCGPSVNQAINSYCTWCSQCWSSSCQSLCNTAASNYYDDCGPWEGKPPIHGPGDWGPTGPSGPGGPAPIAPGYGGPPIGGPNWPVGLPWPSPSRPQGPSFSSPPVRWPPKTTGDCLGAGVDQNFDGTFDLGVCEACCEDTPDPDACRSSCLSAWFYTMLWGGVNSLPIED